MNHIIKELRLIDDAATESVPCFTLLQMVCFGASMYMQGMHNRSNNLFNRDDEELLYQLLQDHRVLLGVVDPELLSKRHQDEVESPKRIETAFQKRLRELHYLIEYVQLCKEHADKINDERKTSL